MMQQQPTPKAEKPYIEPEIIPPGVDWRRSSPIWVSTGPRHTTHIQITRLGPIGIALFVLLIGILASVGLFLLLGAALVGVVAAGVLIGGGIFSSLPRRPISAIATRLRDPVRNVIFGRTGTQIPERVADEEEGRADVRSAQFSPLTDGLRRVFLA
jgi:hypothetical protein